MLRNNPIKKGECMKSIVLSIIILQTSVLLAIPSTSTFVPNYYKTYAGADNGAPVQNMQTFNAAGIRTSAQNFVQCKAAGIEYLGFANYVIPSSINPATITDMQVLVNYSGPDSATQRWTWRIYDWVFQKWVIIGTNVMAFNQGPWTVLKFNVSGPFVNYISSTGELRIQLRSNNTASDAYINYEAISITSDTAAPAPGNSYFVAKSGNNANPGTLAAPWKTISYAAQRVPAGSTVYVRGGIYNERVKVRVSGSASAGFTTFRSFPGELARIDGTGVTIASDSDAASGLVEFANVHYVRFTGFEIRNVNLSSGSVFPAGISIWGTCDHLEMRQNHIHHISNGRYGAHGIGVYGTNAPGAITNLIIDGNELNALTLGQSESLVINGNVQYWTVSNNSIHDNNNIGIDAIGFEGTAPTVAYDQARNGQIIGNLVYNIDGNSNPAYPPNDNSADGIYIDGGTQILIEGNIVHHNNIGIEIACEHSGRTSSYVICRNNIVYLSTGPGISIGGYSSSVGSTDHCTIVNNTLFSNDTFQWGSGEFQIQYFPSTVSNNIFMNNIVYPNSQGVFISNPFSAPIVTLDYNLYYTANVSNADWNWKKRDYSSFNNYKTASGNDSHSKLANPQLISTGSKPIFYCAMTSPVIGAGNNLGEAIVGIIDISGHPRVNGSAIDIGTYEQ